MGGSGSHGGWHSVGSTHTGLLGRVRQTYYHCGIGGARARRFGQVLCHVRPFFL